MAYRIHCVWNWKWDGPANFLSRLFLILMIFSGFQTSGILMQIQSIIWDYLYNMAILIDMYTLTHEFMFMNLQNCHVFN